MAARAAEIHRTMSRALPRVDVPFPVGQAGRGTLWVRRVGNPPGALVANRRAACQAAPQIEDSLAVASFLVAIRDLRAAKDADRGDHADRLKTRGVRVERRHVDTHRPRPDGTGEARKPTEPQARVRRLVQVGEAAEGQLVGEYERIRPGGRGIELSRA